MTKLPTGVVRGGYGGEVGRRRRIRSPYGRIRPFLAWICAAAARRHAVVVAVDGKAARRRPAAARPARHGCIGGGRLRLGMEAAR
ncbi:hypothetical protein OsI_26883 [Oryza sativa Indica Group]|uniref:Uncharacterized protein n=1 Tax=Oryza sativa subsp. indica TaxID=39946 RepID=B8B8K9_ORYSI|nr:hypothetical protein OsI_26883 [Oryza sativa Indica Group]